MAHDGASISGTPPDTSKPAGWKSLLPGLALLLLAGLVYFNAISHPFVYDDLGLVLKNQQVRSLDNIPEMIGFSEEGFSFKTRWTRSVSYALEFAAVGAEPALYHVTNIALHGLIGLLVFLLISRVSRSRLLGWWSAALFVVHPINTEVVAHVAGRRGLLAAFFSLAALLLLERYTSKGGIWRLVLASVSIYLGVFSKELAIMTPVVFVLVDFYARFSQPEETGKPQLSLLEVARRHLWDRRMLYGFLAVLTVCLGSAVLFFSGDVSLEGSPSIYATRGQSIGPLDRAGILGVALRLLILPVGQSVDYSYDAFGLTQPGLQPELLIDMSVLLAALGFFVWGLVRRNWAGFAGAWFVLFYLPHLGIIPWHEVFAERFLYLSSIGVFVGLAAAGIHAARQWSRPVAVMGAVVLVALGAATVARNQVWSSSMALWEDAVKSRPGAARANKAVGDAYLADTRPDLALEHYERAVEILPTYLDARTGIAVAYTARREYASALATIDETLERWPNDAKTLNAKAYIHETLGDMNMAKEAYRLAVEKDPKFADGYNNLGRLYVQEGDLETAIEMYEMAIERNPAMVTALKNLAMVYREGLADEERAAFYEEQARLVEVTR